MNAFGGVIPLYVGLACSPQVYFSLKQGSKATQCPEIKKNGPEVTHGRGLL